MAVFWNSYKELVLLQIRFSLNLFLLVHLDLTGSTVLQDIQVERPRSGPMSQGSRRPMKNSPVILRTSSGLESLLFTSSVTRVQISFSRGTPNSSKDSSTHLSRLEFSSLTERSILPGRICSPSFLSSGRHMPICWTNLERKLQKASVRPWKTKQASR